MRINNLHKLLFLFFAIFFGTTCSGYAQCPKAEGYLSKVEQGQQYSFAGDFESSKCQCLAGVSNERAKELQAAMKYNKDQYERLKKASDPNLGSIPICVISSGIGSRVSGSSDCGDIDKLIELSKEKRYYNDAARFMQFKCNCLNGVYKSKKAQESAMSSMRYYQGTYNNQKRAGDPELVIPSQCSAGSAGVESEKDKFSNLYDDDLIGAGAENLIHDLASNSDNPHLKSLSEGLGKISTLKSDVYSDMAKYNLTMSQSNQEFIQVATNVAQAVEVGKFIVGMFKQSKELSPEIKQANAYIAQTNKNLKLIYNEARVLPSFFNYNVETLKKIEALEKKYLSYDLATAVDRYLIIQYNESKNWFTIDEITGLHQEISQMDKIEVIRKIDEWQRINKVKGNNALANSDVCFNLNQNILNTKKALCYRNMGEDKKADELLNSISFDISNDEAIIAMSDAFKDGDFQLANYFYPIVKGIFETESQPQQFYKFGNTNLSRTQVVQFLATGVYTSIKTRNFTEADNEIAFLENYVNNPPKDYNGVSQIEQYIVLGLKAAYLSLKGNKEKALSTINEALTIQETGYNREGKIWLQQIKFELLAESNRFDEAHKLYVDINAYAGILPSYDLFFNAYDIKYKKCEMLFRQGEYDRVLHGLSILETAHPLAKYYLLRSKVYEATDKEAEAVSELEKYQTFNQ